MILFLFGIGWTAYAWSQPVPVPPNCNQPNFSPPLPPPICGMPTPTAQLFYALGIPAFIVGGGMLFARWYLFVGPGRESVTQRLRSVVCRRVAYGFVVQCRIMPNIF